MITEQNGQVLHETDRVALRRLMVTDRQEFTDLVKISSKLLCPWAFLPSSNDQFDQYLQRFDQITAECILICVRETGDIAGTVSISNIQREPYQRAIVGYNAFQPYVRQGYMSDGMHLVFRFAFDDLKLHRLEADIQPSNRASLAFARRVGFQREGYSPEFIWINGEWRDHERWAIISDSTTGHRNERD